MLKLSNLKSLATVFFALFILSACGGGGDAAAPAAADPVAQTCEQQGLFDNNGICEAKLTVSDCVVDGYNGVSESTNTCATYTAETCVTDGKYWDGSSCEAKLTLADCTDNSHIVVAIRNTCETDNYTAKAESYFNTGGEYNNSKNALGAINAAQAYVNIEALIDEDNNSGAITQAGEGQVVSIAMTHNDDYNAFNANHQEFNNGNSTTAFTDNGVYYAASDVAATNNCTLVSCPGNSYAALIAGRKGNGEMHGIAYNANLKGIVTDNTTAQLTNSLTNGVGADIVAMNHIWAPDTNKSAATTDQLDATELGAWQAAVSGTNKTIMVFATGSDGRNTENGSAGNIPAWRAAYPVLHTDDSHDNGTSADTSDDFSGDFTSDRWLVVTGLNIAGTAIHSNANGCGVAMGFCLAAPGQDIYTPSNSTNQNNSYATTTGYLSGFPSSTVAGALAVLKGAFPNATPEELTALVLDTADYLPLADESADAALIQMVALKDGSASPAMRKINAVYGYGRLNLETATTPNTVSSYVTASNNESMGALWQDTKLTLSSHFGGNFESVTFGIGDAYGRHFITDAPQTSYAPIAVSLDDYMANMLADNVQTQKLGGQAQANYSNSGEQSWMNLEYISGNATTKIAFQDSYKVNPLSETGTTTILRANNIRPASNNIGMMDVDYQLTQGLILSSYLARGEYDTGYKFDELGTDFDVNYKQSHLNIAIGNIREHGQFLGTNTSGAYALNAPSISRFTDVTYGHDLGKFNIYANYINYETDVNMLHDQFASIDGLKADQYQVGFTGKDLMSKDDSLNVALITKLGVTDGALNQNTVLGYTADGAFNNASQSYDLAVSDRHQQFEITYQGRLYQNADKISALRDNRFFTSIRVDSNLNHVQGASQVEVVSGINIRY